MVASKGSILLASLQIIDRVALTELLKTTILSLYNANTLSNKYVGDVGHAWDREKFALVAG